MVILFLKSFHLWVSHINVCNVLKIPSVLKGLKVTLEGSHRNVEGHRSPWRNLRIGLLYHLSNLSDPVPEIRHQTRNLIKLVILTLNLVTAYRIDRKPKKCLQWTSIKFLFMEWSFNDVSILHNGSCMILNKSQFPCLGVHLNDKLLHNTIYWLFPGETFLCHIPN
jgi:hypothetical protein